MSKNLLDYMPAFYLALQKQLMADQERWGDEWKKRPIEPNEEYKHQNVRIYHRIMEYYKEWVEDEVPIPWLKVAGLAVIAWVRETYPDTYSNE